TSRIQPMMRKLQGIQKKMHQLERIIQGGPTRDYGEEDLAALVCAAIVSAGSCLVYGLPGKGVVLVRTDAKVNQAAQRLIRSMEVLK
ncbi:MAG TPA: DUF359 domain-containing protein, partial [Methanomassiliicoccales archaeon]|nr:DUF359 domain-containing protein [Methanomassiliicoccales archaeon]